MTVRRLHLSFGSYDKTAVSSTLISGSTMATPTTRRIRATVPVAVTPFVAFRAYTVAPRHRKCSENKLYIRLRCPPVAECYSRASGSFYGYSWLSFFFLIPNQFRNSKLRLTSTARAQRLQDARGTTTDVKVGREVHAT